jgi:hypothetical protein
LVRNDTYQEMPRNYAVTEFIDSSSYRLDSCGGGKLEEIGVADEGELLLDRLEQVDGSRKA